MNEKKECDDEPVGEVTRVRDFLPPPSQLVPREETVKGDRTFQEDLQG